MVRSAVLMIVLILGGCATVKPYPVCFFDPFPLDEEKAIKHSESLLNRIKMDSPTAHMAPDGRWIYAKTTICKHREISKTWPRVACIGSVTSGTEVKRYADCISYLETLLIEQNYLELDIANNVVDSDEAPGEEHVICGRKP